MKCFSAMKAIQYFAFVLLLANNAPADYLECYVCENCEENEGHFEYCPPLEDIQTIGQLMPEIAQGIEIGSVPPTADAALGTTAQGFYSTDITLGLEQVASEDSTAVVTPLQTTTAAAATRPTSENITQTTIAVTESNHAAWVNLTIPITGNGSIKNELDLIGTVGESLTNLTVTQAQNLNLNATNGLVLAGTILSNITTSERPNSIAQSVLNGANTAYIEGSNNFVALTNQSSVLNASNQNNILGVGETVNTTTSDQYPAPTTAVTGHNTTTPGRPNATPQTGSTSENTTVVEVSNDFDGLRNQSSLINASNETNILELVETAYLSSANTSYQNAAPTAGLTGLNTSTTLGSPNATLQTGLTSGNTTVVEEANDFVGLTNQSSVFNASNETNILGLVETGNLSSANTSYQNAAPTTGLTGLNTSTTLGSPNATLQTGLTSGNTTVVEEATDFVGLTNQSSVFNASNEANILGLVETGNLSSANTSYQNAAPTTGLTGLNTSTTLGSPNATQQTGNSSVVEGSNDFAGLTNQSSLISASNETNTLGLAETADLSSANTSYQNAAPTTGLTGLNTSTTLESPNATLQIGLTSGNTTVVEEANDFVGLTNQSSVFNASNETNILGLVETGNLSSANTSYQNAAPTTGLTGLNTSTTLGSPNATFQTGLTSGNTTVVEEANDFVGLTNQSSVFNASNETNILGLVETGNLISANTSYQNAAPTTGLTGLNTSTTLGSPNATLQTGLTSGNTTVVEEANDFVGLTNQSSVFNASNETNILGLVETGNLSSANTSYQNAAPTTGLTGLNTSTTLGSPNATLQTGLTSGNTTVVEEANDFVGLTNQSSVFNASNETNILGLAETADLSSANTFYQNAAPTTGLTGENVILVEGSNDAKVIRPMNENSLRRSSRKLLQHKYSIVGDLARMKMGNITYKCYSVRVKGKNKLQINKGCVAVRPEQNACALLADKYGAEALEDCQVCLEGKCNHSYGNALIYSAKVGTLIMSIGWLIGAIMS